MPPQFYRIRVAGHLGPEWSEWFDGWDVVQEPDGTTVLSGLVPDQAALHGLLMRLRDLGIVLEGVEHVTPDAADGCELTRGHRAHGQS